MEMEGENFTATIFHESAHSFSFLPLSGLNFSKTTSFTITTDSNLLPAEVVGGGGDNNNNNSSSSGQEVSTTGEENNSRINEKDESICVPQQQQASHSFEDQNNHASLLTTATTTTSQELSSGTQGSGSNKTDDPTTDELATALESVVIRDVKSNSTTDGLSSDLENNQVQTGKEDLEQEKDVLRWSPLDPQDLEGPESSEYLFTQEELAEALRFLGDDETKDESAPETQRNDDGDGNNNDHIESLGPIETWEGTRIPSPTPIAESVNPSEVLDEAALLQNLLLGEDLNFRSVNEEDDDEEEAFLLPTSKEELAQIFLAEDPQDLANTSSETDPNETSAPSLSFEQDFVAQSILEQLQGLSLSVPPAEATQEDDSSSDIPPLQEIERTSQSEAIVAKNSTRSAFGLQSNPRQQLDPTLQLLGSQLPFLQCEPCPVSIEDEKQGLNLALPPPVEPTDDEEDSDNNQDGWGETAEKERALTTSQKPDPSFLLGDDVLPYLQCQPCGDPTGEAPPPPPFPNNQFIEDTLDLAELDAMMAEFGITTEVPPPNDTRIINSNNDHEEEPEAVSDNSFPRPVASPSVLAAAKPYLDTFGVQPTEIQSPTTSEPEPPKPSSKVFHNKGERSCLGHRERILSVRFSVHGTLMATASADSTIRIWRPTTNTLLSTLSHHDQNYECLRVAWATSEWFKDADSMKGDQYEENSVDKDEEALLATAGADGQVFILKRRAKTSTSSKRKQWDTMACINHAKDMHHYTPADAEDRPQIYALQFIDNFQVSPNMACSHVNNRILLTSSENHLHFWELIQEPKPQDKLETVMEENDDDEDDDKQDSKEEPPVYPWHFREMFSVGFGNLHTMGGGVSVGRVTDDANPYLPITQVAEGDTNEAFGGERNPNGLIYVFDAAYCPVNGLIGVALSDGSLRLLNGRGVCVSILQLPGVSTHLTSFCWDASGTQLATSVASTGHVVTWEIIMNKTRSDVQRTSCRAVLGGGHDRTVFGMRYCGNPDEAGTEPWLVSWGADGRLALWEALVDGEVDAPIATLVNRPEYPIFGLDFDERTRHMALVGGDGDGGFIGIPVKLFDVHPEAREKTPNVLDESKGKSYTQDTSKKPKLVGSKTGKNVS